LLLICMCATASSGCDSGGSARLPEVEKAAAEQTEKIDALDKRLKELEAKVFMLDFMKDRYKSATLDPAERGFDRIDSSVGSFAVSLQHVSAHADGVLVRLHVGNLTTATVSGGKFKVKWGPRIPKGGGEKP